jgi:site-specific DNA-methyltransferase (adenine-specific)
MTTFEIFNADCLEHMKSIPDNSINLMVADLPYGETDCKWDCVIDLENFWIELKRILKPNGQCLFFCSTKFGNSIINSNPKWYRSDMVWEKTKGVGHLNARIALLRKHELIYLFHNPTKPKDLKWTYNPQMVKGEPYSRGKTNNTKSNVYNKKEIEILHENLTGDRFPNSILRIGNTANNSKKMHPTQKPIELYQWLIKTYSNEGDLIFDPTFGSCNSGQACINLKRSYIGIEMDKGFYDKAVERFNINTPYL